MYDIDAEIASRFTKAAVENKWEEIAPAMAQASLPKSKTYLNTGPNTTFDKDLVNPQFGSDTDKPWGTLYGSVFIPEGVDTSLFERVVNENGDVDFKSTPSKAYSEWDRWTATEMPQWHADTGFTFEYVPGANVLNIRAEKDLDRLPREYFEPDTFQLLKEWVGQDRFWDLLSKKMKGDEREMKNAYSEMLDALRAGKIDPDTIPMSLNMKKLAENYDAVDFGDWFGYTSRDGRVGRYSVPILDAAQTILFNPEIVTNVKPWHRPGTEGNFTGSREPPEKRQKARAWSLYGGEDFQKSYDINQRMNDLQAETLESKRARLQNGVRRLESLKKTTKNQSKVKAIDDYLNSMTYMKDVDTKLAELDKVYERVRDAGIAGRGYISRTRGGVLPEYSDNGTGLDIYDH